MKKPFIITVLILATALLAAVVIFITHRNSVVPSNIQKQVNFVILYPTNNQAKIQKKSFKYDASIKSLSFIVDYQSRQITFAEQASPDSFADDPSFYPKFVDKLNPYATFESIEGRVDLTRPPQVKNETAVMKAKGTLLFAKSSGDLSESSWRQLFKSLEVVK